MTTLLNLVITCSFQLFSKLPPCLVSSFFVQPLRGALAHVAPWRGRGFGVSVSLWCAAPPTSRRRCKSRARKKSRDSCASCWYEAIGLCVWGGGGEAVIEDVPPYCRRRLVRSRGRGKDWILSEVRGGWSSLAGGGGASPWGARMSQGGQRTIKILKKHKNLKHSLKFLKFL